MLAVLQATRAARDFALKENKPIIIEAMTYRIGHHSTSDDSSAYRPLDEVKQWDEKDHPIARFQNFLKLKGLWTDEEESSWKEDTKKQVSVCF